MEQAKLFETFKVRNHNACVLEESLPNINPFSKDEPIVQNAAEDSDADVEEEEKSDQIESLKLIDALHRSSSVLRMVTMMLYDPENGEEKARARKVYAVRWLGQMKQSQVKQRRLDSLMNAFIKWNLEFPLAQKCDELAKQLRERNNALENVRSSYLRDVLSVKLHLDRLLDLAAKTEGQFSQLIADTLYDLHAVPSLDLRGLVKEAQGAPGQSSAQLRDNFVDLGILDPATLRTLNPWDQSHGYKRIQRLEKGHAYKMPAAEGESFQLAAPIAKRLYVRYCRECIGMTALIKDWNNEVEESLKFKADFSNVDKIIQEFRGLVIRLNGTIAHQERQIVDLTDRNHNLERANMWFEKWSGTEVVDSDELVEQRLMYKRIAEMTRVDMESLAMRTAQRFVERQNEWRAEGQLLRHKLNTAGEQKDVNYKQRVKLLDDLKKSQGALAQRALEAAHLEETCRRTLELQAAEKAKADKHVVVLDFNINELNNIVEAQEERHVTLKREMGDKVEQLTFKLQQAESELVISEDTIDQIHDELREAKTLYSNSVKEIAALRTRCELLEAQLPPPRPRFTFRAVCMAVLFCVRYGRALRSDHLEDLGKRGYEKLLKRARKHVKQVDKQLNAAQGVIFAHEESSGLLAADRESYQYMLHDARGNLRDAHGEVDTAHLEVKRVHTLMGELALERDKLLAFKRSMEVSQDALIRIKVAEAIERQHAACLGQAKMHAQVQRNLGLHLGRSLFSMRTLLGTLQMDENIKALEKPYERTILPEGSVRTGFAPTAMSSKRSRKFVELVPTIQRKGRSVIAWMRKHRVTSAIPKKVSVFLRKVPVDEPSGVVVDVSEDADDALVPPALAPFGAASAVPVDAASAKLIPIDAAAVALADALATINAEAARRATMAAVKAKEAQRMEKRWNTFFTHSLEKDWECVELIREHGLKEIWEVHDYVQAYQRKHYELLAVIDTLERELSEAKPKPRRIGVSSIKASFSHMLRNSTVEGGEKKGSYFSKVLNAIEKVQSEQGEALRDKLTTSGKLHLVNFVKRPKGSIRIGGSLKKTAEDTPTAPMSPIKMPTGSIRIGSALKKTAEDTPTAPMSPIKMPTGSISIGSALKKTAEDTPTAPMLPMALMGQRKPSFNSSFFGSSRQPAFEPICEDSFMRVDSFMRKDSFQSDSVADEPDTPQSGGMQVWTPTPQLSGAYASPQPSPAKVHSAKVHMRSVRMAPELFAPPEQVSSKSTIGFEDSDKIDYMDGEHENEHEDEDIRFMEELETARQEMLVQLHREQAAQAKVDVAEGECAVLSNQIGVLVSRLEEMELKMAELKSRCKEMNSERGSADRELEQKEHENQLLREIVHEDYRYHTAAMERALSAQEDAERSRHTPVQRSDQGTQIACSVCAIRAGDAPYVDHDHDGYDEDTVAMANETLGRALQGVVLVAQPRHINAATKRELLSRLQSSMQQDPRERERDREKERAWEREQRERELREQEQREREQKLKRRHKNRHADGNSSPVEGKLGKRTKLGIGGDEPRGERKERVFTQQDIFNHIENAQHQLLDYRDPVRTKVLSSEQEQSKFSKLKKMPQKVQLSASTGPIYFNTRAPSPEKMPSSALPPSAQLKLPRPQSAQSALRRSSQRTASHTAAYFQNQHMGDEHVLPLFMPVSSEHGPLSSLAYASRLAHQSSPHVVLAEPQKRALSANAAQRQRLQVEVPLAMATVRMEESQDSPMSPSSAEPADLANKHMLGHTLDFSGKESVEICTYEKYALRS